MIQGKISLYINNDYGFTLPKIYSNGEWKIVQPYVYINNNWKLIGGTQEQLVYFLTSNGEFFIDANGNTLLVKG